MRNKVLMITALVLLTAALALADEKKPMTIDDLFSFDRVGSPALSPDGKWVAFTVTKVDREGGRNKTNIYLVPAEGGEPRQLTNSGGDYSPLWSPCGKYIAFISGRGGSGQIWLINVDGGEARQLSNIATGASGHKWSPDGKMILCSTMVLPGKCDKGTKAAMDEKEKTSKTSARVMDDLLYRHWDTWRDDGTKNHLYVVDVATGEHRDLMKDFAYDVPPFPFGGDSDYDWSPDCKEVAFATKTAPNPAWHTNQDIYTVSVDSGEMTNITEAFEGQDNHPLYSPDGRYIAYAAMERPRFEADQIDIILYDRQTGERKNLTKDFDRTIGEFGWAPDSKTVLLIPAHEGRRPIFRMTIEGGEPELVVSGGYITNLNIGPDGAQLVFARRCLSHPPEIFTIATGGEEKQLTHFTRPVLDRVYIGKVEEHWFEGDRGDKVHLFTVLPPGFDPDKKWPLLHIIHGGPQQDYADLWTYGWNSQLFASQGYVVALVAFHATPGYGKDFVDAVSRNWGGSPYIDIMKGTDYLIGLGYIDEDRMAAGGGSYGGYMVDWICGQTDRFKALISHSGVYDLESMYGATEELWFPEWELNGLFWENPELYEKWSPHKYAANFKTPTLILHGQLDYRVPVTQSMEFFTALRRQGVPARFVYYPDENHWILRTGNQMHWYQEFLDWIEKYVGGGPK